MGNYSGGKFSSSHSTLIEAAKPLIKFVVALPEVEKISLGFIRSIKSNGTNLHRMKLDLSEPACLKVTVRGGTSVQELRLYTSNSLVVANKICKKFPSVL